VERIRSERRGLTVEQPGPQPEETLKKPGAAETREFAEFLQTTSPSFFEDPPAERNSPSQDIADFIMPRLAEPSLLQAGRSLMILEELMGTIIPRFDDSEEFQSVATAVIHSEITRRRDLQERLHRGISA
jgi:hypothetical protein